MLQLHSKIDFGHKLAVSAGTLSNSFVATTKQKDNCRHSSENKQNITEYRWTAPPDGVDKTVTFGGLCGDMRTNVVLFAARQKTSALSAAGIVVAGGCPFDAAAQEPPLENTADQFSKNIPLLAGIGAVVVVGLGFAGFFTYRRKNKAAERATEAIGELGSTVKQRMQSFRPAAAVGRLQSFRPMATPQPSRTENTNMQGWSPQMNYENNYPGGNNGLGMPQRTNNMNVQNWSPPSNYESGYPSTNQGGNIDPRNMRQENRRQQPQQQEQFAYPGQAPQYALYQYPGQSSLTSYSSSSNPGFQQRY